MYPNLYYVFKAWFGVEWKSLQFLNTFGLMVAMGFLVAAFFISLELKRKEKQGLLYPRDETIVVGKPASLLDLLLNFITGFLFGYKMIGLFIDKPDHINPQDYIFSTQGNIVAGIVLGGILTFLKWRDANRQKLQQPEKRVVRIWPHDRVGDIVIISLIAGIVGAKLFDNFENWDDFIQHPMERIFSAGGLTFYGGFIVAAIAIIWYAKNKNIKLAHLIDAIAPAMMIAYAVGRIGCQVAGDGDWGIYNSAYITDSNNKAVLAKPGEYTAQLNKYSTYFLNGDRKSEGLQAVPHYAFVAPKWVPIWLVAYNYPQNVNKDGILMSNTTDEHNKVLPVPVYPTPLYETIMCALLYVFLWAIRKRIKIAGVITGLYLILNGAERFTIEKIRVNNHADYWGLSLSQAELISSSLILIGIVIIGWVTFKNKKVS